MRRATLIVITVGLLGAMAVPVSAQITGRGAAAPGGPCGPLGCQEDPWGWNRFYYGPEKYRIQPRVHAAPNESGLRYYRFTHPYADYDYYRRTYPHSFRGTFGDAPRPRDLTLRFRVSPGYSPYSRYHHDDALRQHIPIDPVSPESDDYESGALRELFRDAVAPMLAPAPAPAPAPVIEDDVSRSHEVFVPGAKPRSRTISKDERRAWTTVAAGEARDAQERFSTLALAYPAVGRHKAGFALCRALQGDDAAAVWNMRRAVRFDAASLADVPLDAALVDELRMLLARYDEDGSHELSEKDATFMTAALHFVLQEHDAARDAIRAGFERGEVDAAALRLMLLITEANQPPSLMRRNGV